jgi:hypothetical protein
VRHFGYNSGGELRSAARSSQGIGYWTDHAELSRGRGRQRARPPHRGQRSAGRPTRARIAGCAWVVRPTRPPHRGVSGCSAPGEGKTSGEGPRFPRTGGTQTLVRKGGLEPPRPFGHGHLKPARLPISPLPPALPRGQRVEKSLDGRVREGRPGRSAENGLPCRSEGLRPPVSSRRPGTLPEHGGRLAGRCRVTAAVGTGRCRRPVLVISAGAAPTGANQSIPRSRRSLATWPVALTL